MKIVTINREFGACGRSVGMAVAKELGVELYDRDIIRALAKESGLDYDYLNKSAETMSKAESFIRRITPMQYDHKDNLFDMQKEVVLRLASQGPCVILGRCADAILDDNGFDCFRVFLSGDDKFRAENTGKIIGLDDTFEMYRALKKLDSNRIAYYERYSGRNWGDYQNYHLMLNVGQLGVERCVKYIVEAVKE